LASNDPPSAEEHLLSLSEQISAMPAESPWHQTLELAKLYAQSQSDPGADARTTGQLASRPAVELEAIYLYDRLMERANAF
jgi:hypothetical protein